MLNKCRLYYRAVIVFSVAKCVDRLSQPSKPIIPGAGPAEGSGKSCIQAKWSTIPLSAYTSLPKLLLTGFHVNLEAH